MERTENSKGWQESSDGWVKTMTESKENKEQYKKYADRTNEPMTYRDWLRDKNEK